VLNFFYWLNEWSEIDFGNSSRVEKVMNHMACPFLSLTVCKRLQMNNWNTTKTRCTYITCCKDKSSRDWRTFHLTSSPESVMYIANWMQNEDAELGTSGKKNGSHIHTFHGVSSEINYFTLCSTYTINLMRLYIYSTCPFIVLLYCLLCCLVGLVCLWVNPSALCHYFAVYIL